MCLATLGLVGAATSALGSIGGGIAQGQSAAYQAQIARNNAIAAGNNAMYASAAGQQAAATTAMKGAAASAKIKAGQAASGIDVNSGSAVDVQGSQREVNELNTENVLHNAELQSYGYRTQQSSFNAQADLDRRTSETAPIGGLLSAGGGLLSNASSIGTKFGGFNGIGSFFSGLGDIGNTSLPNNSNGQLIGYDV